MIDHINCYRLNTKISEYSKDDFFEFTAYDYRIAEEQNRVPQFRNEVFYRAENSEFLGRHWNAMVSAIDGVICKVSISKVEPDKNNFLQLKKKVEEYMTDHMGPCSEDKQMADTSLFIWDSEQGNVVLQCDTTYIEVILTSCALKMANLKQQKPSFFGHIFGGKE